MSHKSVFLLPGEAHFSKDPAEISTLLGSCVAVCIYDRNHHWGGMNHYMLPTQGSGDGHLSPGKYGDYALRHLVKMAQLAGSRRTDVVASVFGGGRVVGHLGSIAAATGGFDIGERNIEAADAFLRQLEIPIVRREVGGAQGRKIHLDTATGEIRSRLIQSSADTQERARKTAEVSGRKVKILVVDDSATVRRALSRGINLAPDLEVVGEAENPYDARGKILELDPDVLCLDIIMPRLDGLSFLRKIMRYKPIPTVIVSTIAKKGSAMEAKVREAGAVDVIDKEELELYRGVEVIERVLLPKLRAASTTVVHRREEES